MTPDQSIALHSTIAICYIMLFEFIYLYSFNRDVNLVRPLADDEAEHVTNRFIFSLSLF